MAVQAFPYLVMTDGTDTVTFANGLGTTTNWPPARGTWGPSIAGVRTSPLAGRGPYADVIEDLSCNIRDTTAALVYTDLDTLTRLLDKAERWWLRNELISPVVLKYAPQGSTIHSTATPMQAIVLGRTGSDELNGVDLPNSLNDAGMIFEIRGVRVLCLRRGAWTGLSETPSASAAITNPGVMTKAFASTHPINSPVDITLGGFDKTATPTIQAGFLVVASNVNDIQFSDNGGSIVAGFTNVADAGNLAKFGSVLRYTPTTTNVATTGVNALAGSAMSGTVAMYAALRNNSGTTTFLVRGYMSGVSGFQYTPYQLVDTSTLNPRLIYLGTITGSAMTNVGWAVQASAAAGTLDMDYILCVNLRDETCAVIAHDAIDVSLISSGAVSLNFKFNPTVDQNPSVYASGTSLNSSLNYRGPLPLLSVGSNIYALWMSTNSNFWCMTNNVGAAITNTITVTRYRSYLSPQ